MEQGHQHVQLNEGHQKFWLLNGHQTFHLVSGDQHFQLDSGRVTRWVNGIRLTLYTGKCKEITTKHWQFNANDWFKIKAPTIILEGDVLITGRVQMLKTLLVGDDIKSYANIGAVKDICGKTLIPDNPGNCASAAPVDYQDDPDYLAPGDCTSSEKPSGSTYPSPTEVVADAVRVPAGS
jgi:hypothetical protein